MLKLVAVKWDQSVRGPDMFGVLINHVTSIYNSYNLNIKFKLKLNFSLAYKTFADVGWSLKSNDS